MKIPHAKIREVADQIRVIGFRNCAETLEQFIQQLESQMGQTAIAINSLESTITSQAATITTLQSQLAAATALEPDSADQAAVAGVPAFIAALTTAPAATAAPATPVVPKAGS